MAPLPDAQVCLMQPALPTSSLAHLPSRREDVGTARKCTVLFYSVGARLLHPLSKSAGGAGCGSRCVRLGGPSHAAAA